MKYYLYRMAAILFMIGKWFFMAIFLITLFGLIMPYFKDSLHFDYIRYMVGWSNQINLLVHQYIPTKLGGQDISYYITLGVSFIAIAVMSNYRYEFDYRARLLSMGRPPSKLIEKLAESKEGAKKVAILDETMKKIQKSDRREREKLLADYVAMKKELESIGRNMAFLAIDVVDSTGMKKSEDPIIVSHDFIEYRKLVESKLNAYGYVKSSWTPDGLMACFNTLEEAVSAAQAIIKELPNFNRNVKAMKADFAIRCGINMGYLLFDETLPLEQITDRVIDIAGHMQKCAAPNSIYIAKNIVLAPVRTPEHFMDAAKKVDDLDVYMWHPEDGAEGAQESNESKEREVEDQKEDKS